MPTAAEVYQLKEGQLVKAELVRDIYEALKKLEERQPAEVLLDLRAAAQDATHKVSRKSRMALDHLGFLTVRSSGHLMIGGVQSLVIEQCINKKGKVVRPTLVPISN